MAAGGEKVDTSIPFNLPLVHPPLVIDGKLEHRLRQPEQALVRLDLAGEMVPSLNWFIYAFDREADVDARLLVRPRCLIRLWIGQRPRFEASGLELYGCEPNPYGHKRGPETRENI